METTQLTSKLFKLFILFILVITFNRCGGSSSNDEIDNFCQTFLECQGGTVWEGQLDIFMYLKINNNQNNPVEIYLPGENCYYHSSINETVFEILENSKNTLKIKVEDDSENSFEIITFSITNDNLYIKEVYVENGVEDSSTGTFTKSTKDLSSVIICD